MSDTSNYRSRSQWTLRSEFQRWTKSAVALVPGVFGSALRRQLYPFARVGQDVYLGESFYAEYPSRLSIGSHVSINRGCMINAGGGVTIEDWVIVGPGVMIYSQNHDLAGDPSIPFALLADVRQPVVIGAGCWLGAGCIILPGTVLGPRSVVGAGAVVTSNTSAGSIVGGVPARPVRPAGLADLPVGPTPISKGQPLP